MPHVQIVAGWSRNLPLPQEGLLTDCILTVNSLALDRSVHGYSDCMSAAGCAP